MPQASTTRPVTATVLAVIQSAIAGANIAVAILVVLAMRAPEVRPHAIETTHAVMLNAALVIIAALITTFAAVGLWRRWAAAWGLTLALSLAVFLGILWGPIFDHDHLERDDLAVTIVFALTIILALLGPVRRWYLGSRSATTLSSDSTNLKTGY